MSQQPQQTEITFQTASGALPVRRTGERLAMEFPVRQLSTFSDLNLLRECLGVDVLEATVAGPTVLAVVQDQETVSGIKPDLAKIANLPFNALVPTAIGANADFVSRFFGPRIGIPEDPVTGAAHTGLAPFWSARLGKDKLHARQLSARGGQLWCDVSTERVVLTGLAESFAQGELSLEL